MATVAGPAAEGPAKTRPLFKRWSQTWEGPSVDVSDRPRVRWHPDRGHP